MFYPGTMTALMGPSGAGKTTLLNVLSKRAKGRLAGQVLLNDRPTTALEFKTLANYVPQDDDMMTMFSPRTQLMYVAALRLPPLEEMTRQQRVDELLALLGLEECADTKIGGGFDGVGCSGGQRKRVSIAMELVNEPSVLFLDEPTSGLDSAMAEEVIKSVRDLSQRGLNVVCTIHQPAPQVFFSFDQLVLLFKGRLCYIGPPSSALQYFRAASLLPDEDFTQMNPADVVLGVLAKTPGSEATEIGNKWSAARRGLMANYTKDDGGPKNPPASSAVVKAALEEYPVSKFDQFKILFQRATHDHILGRLKIQVFMSLFIGFFYGLVFLHVDNKQKNYNVRLSACFMTIIYNGMMCVTQMSTVMPLDKRVVLREYRNGYYSLVSYMCSQILMRLVMQAMATTMWALVFYNMAGLSRGQHDYHFFVFLITVFMLATNGLIYGFMIGCVAVTPQKAQQLQVPLQMPLVIFSGFLIQYDSVRWYFKPLWFISFFRYAFTILVINEFQHGTFDYCEITPNHLCVVGQGYQPRKRVITDVLEFHMNAIPNFFYVLIGYGVAFSVLAYFVLKYKANGSE